MPSEGSPFSSTEEYYAEYRPGYGQEAFDYLQGRFSLDPSDVVLDLGCGAGQVALPLAKRVGHVVGMDPNEAMLERASEKADAAGLTDVEWRRGSDGDLSPEMGPFDLVTMGRSFHWMDRERTLELLSRIVRPGGGVALLNDDDWFTRGTRAWQDEVYDLAAEFVEDLPERTGPVEEYPNPWDELIAEFGFVDIEKHDLEFEREWTVDDVVGYVFSLSYCSPETFGDDREAFEAAARSLLAADRRETFPQTASVTVISGRTPVGD